jgi:hypothetical protein
VQVVQNLCSICRYRRRGLACDAFPDRIPKDIRMMYADHRLPYPGDGGTQFEVRDTAKARQQLHQVKVLKKPRRRPNDLDRRIAVVWPLIQLNGPKERRQFRLVALNAETFEQLPWTYQQLILEAEQRHAQETNLPQEKSAHVKVR